MKEVMLDTKELQVSQADTVSKVKEEITVTLDLLDKKENHHLVENKEIWENLVHKIFFFSFLFFIFQITLQIRTKSTKRII